MDGRRIKETPVCFSRFTSPFLKNIASGSQALKGTFITSPFKPVFFQMVMSLMSFSSLKVDLPHYYDTIEKLLKTL